MHAAMESCPGKTAVSGVMGFCLGGVFGMFMSSVGYPQQNQFLLTLFSFSFQ